MVISSTSTNLVFPDRSVRVILFVDVSETTPISPLFSTSFSSDTRDAIFSFNSLICSLSFSLPNVCVPDFVGVGVDLDVVVGVVFRAEVGDTACAWLTKSVTKNSDKNDIYIFFIFFLISSASGSD